MWKKVAVLAVLAVVQCTPVAEKGIAENLISAVSDCVDKDTTICLKVNSELLWSVSFSEMWMITLDCILDFFLLPLFYFWNGMCLLLLWMHISIEFFDWCNIDFKAELKFLLHFGFFTCKYFLPTYFQQWTFSDHQIMGFCQKYFCKHWFKKITVWLLLTY